jgi:hypothetical protein
MAERHDETKLAIDCLTLWLEPNREQAAAHISSSRFSAVAGIGLGIS